MKFEDLSYDELLNVDGGKERNWLRIVGTGIFTVGATVASGGVLPAGAAIAGGVLSIASQL